MSKNISIDELFHDKLSQGKEQLNLGAWANMERMLDGKAPYSSDDESKKKKRIFPFLGLLLLLTASITAGFLMRNHKKDKSLSKVVPTQAQNTYAQNEPTTTTQSEFANASNTAEPVKAAVNESQTEKSNIPSSRNERISRQSHPSTSSNPRPSGDLNNNTNTQNVEDNNILTKSTTEHFAKEDNKKRNHSSTAVTLNTNETASNTDIEKDVNETNKQTLPKKSKFITKLDTIQQIKIMEKVSRKRNGDSPQVSFDTMDVHDKIVETTVEVIEPIDYHISNPRYVDLNPENEVNANKKENPALASTNSESVTNKDLPAVDHNDVQIKLESANVKKQGFFDYIGDVTKSYMQKIAETSRNIASKKLLLYPGMSAGINAALFNTQHNYGGFHIGASNVIPVSNYFSVLSELKLFYRRNSGFTVRDIQTTMVDSHSDTLSLHAEQKTIYAYQLDSTVRKYNFKNMYSVELPLTLQFNKNKLSFYVGANFVYNFGLSTKEILSKTPVTHVDTMNNSKAYYYPTNKSYEYMREDFGARFGIGYLFGAAYSFSPRLYVDLRLSQTQWDNSKTLSSRAISSGVYKVPYMQISLGYRFKDFSPGIKYNITKN